MEFPKMLRVRQTFDAREVGDIAASVTAEMAGLDLASRVKPGQTVAVACSSRGITNYTAIVKAVVSSLKSMQLDPFIFPAMGSHGSATAEGQQRVLEHLGISEQTVGAPVRSSLEVVQLGDTMEGIPVYVDRLASEADHIVLVNRIKKHTEFEHKFESGLMKMMAIGLGKQAGAAMYHQAMLSFGYAHVIQSIADNVLQRANILCGVGIVENGYGQTAKIGIGLREKIEDQEVELFKLAKSLSPALPFEEADVIIIDEMGKEISGSGFDTKVVGRIGMPLVTPDPEMPRIKRIMVCDLTEASEGNAVGVGIADVITRRLRDKIDQEALDMNTITGVCPEPGRIPLTLQNEREALDVAIRCVGLVPLEKLKIMRIKNTLRLSEVEVSEGYAAELKTREDLDIIRDWYDMEFDADGNLFPF
ncbi:MAG: lactate racemase domain-containing protein [Thermodesulfobacteriota bacterium]